MAMSLKMARWIDQMASAADEAARLVWNGQGDTPVALPHGTEVPGAAHVAHATTIPAIDLLRALVADHERDSEDTTAYFAPPPSVANVPTKSDGTPR
jgi:hypothetical protein